MISREEAIKNLSEWLALAEERGSYYGEEAIPTYKLAIEALSQPERPKGRWKWKHRMKGGFHTYTGVDSMGKTHTITVDERYETEEPYCPNCGKWNDSQWLDFCPNCGSDNRGEEE